jgi:hypothetical protein
MATVLLWADFLLYSDRVGTSRRHQHCQYGGTVAHVCRDCYQFFCHKRILLRQCLKTRADVAELIDFAQDRFKRHGHTALLLKNLRWEDVRWTGLRSEDLKEEKLVTTPASL